MIRYIIRRLLQTVLVLFLVMTLVFVILRVVGDPAKMMVTPDSSYEDLQNIRRILGLDQPIWKQYLNYLSDVLRGDFGSSYYFERPVIDLLKERLPATLKLGFISLAVSLPLALLFGVISAIKRNSLLDNAVTTFVVMGRSIPTFWFASLMVLIFSVQLKWLPASGYGETRQLYYASNSYVLRYGSERHAADSFSYAGCDAAGLYHNCARKRCGGDKSHY